MWRESLTKQATMMDNITRMRENVKLRHQETTEKLVLLTSMQGDIQTKTISAARQIEALQSMVATGFDAAANNTGDAGGSGGQINFQRDSDMKSMKELNIDERKKRENANKDIQKQME